MLARLFILLGSFAFASSAFATTVDCRQSPTFMRPMPGGQELVYHCGCEPPDGSTTCSYPSGSRPANYTVIPMVYQLSGPANERDRESAGGAVLNRVPFTQHGNRLGLRAPNPRPCVGLCYGTTSQLTGRPRNYQVRAHYRSNGTYVDSYTRSRPSRSGRSGRRR